MKIDNTARNAEIVRRRRRGEFPWKITKEMGLSRNTVIGACHRAGIVKADNRRATEARFAERGASVDN